MSIDKQQRFARILNVFKPSPTKTHYCWAIP
jgi:hypothetical protein